ncbi:MAG: TIGR01906 family membrane protein, partial [Oscillospiraceae bacterium]
MRKKITDIGLALVLTVAIISLAAVVTLNSKALYYGEINSQNLPQITGMEEGEIRENYDALIDYNRIFFNGELKFPTLPMSPEGKIHFAEVKNIFVAIQIALGVSLLLLVGGGIDKIRKREFGFLRLGAILTVVLPTVLGGLIATNWQWFFVAFHHLMFRNDYWIFDAAKDPVILMLPDSFFLHCALLILGIVLALSAASFLLWARLRRKKAELLPMLHCDSSVLRSGEIIKMLRKSMALADKKLIDHGDRVAFLLYQTLKHSGTLEKYDFNKLFVLSVFHDIGAQKVDDVEDLLLLKTNNMMRHSVYGYVFLRHLSPLADYADAILYHHTSYRDLMAHPIRHSEYAQLLHLADRIDVAWQNRGELDETYFRKHGGGAFNPEFVEMFIAADKELHLVEQCRTGAYRENFENMMDTLTFSPEEVFGYLKMTVFLIDFVSAQTVTHTINTTEISAMLGKYMDFSGKEADLLVYGAFLHDIGKIGIPPSILESSGKLSPEEMEVMKTHVRLTDEILLGVVDDDVRNISARHHEKLDGSGYPKGLLAKDLRTSER